MHGFNSYYILFWSISSSSFRIAYMDYCCSFIFDLCCSWGLALMPISQQDIEMGDTEDLLQQELLVST